MADMLIVWAENLTSLDAECYLIAAMMEALMIVGAYRVWMGRPIEKAPISPAQKSTGTERK